MLHTWEPSHWSVGTYHQPHPQGTVILLPSTSLKDPHSRKDNSPWKNIYSQYSLSHWQIWGWGAGYLTRACLVRCGNTRAQDRLRSGTLEGVEERWRVYHTTDSYYNFDHDSMVPMLLLRVRRLQIRSSEGKKCQILQDKLQHSVVMRTLKQNERQYPSDIMSFAGSPRVGNGNEGRIGMKNW